MRGMFYKKPDRCKESCTRTEEDEGLVVHPCESKADNL